MTHQIIINIDDEMYNNIINNFKESEQDLIKDAIINGFKEYITKNDYKVFKDIVFKESAYKYEGYELTNTFSDILKNLDYSALQPIVDAGVEVIKEHYSDILITSIANIMIRSIANSEENSSAIFHGLGLNMDIIKNEIKRSLENKK